MDVEYQGLEARLPDFLVVGAARSGTSTLCSLLESHPRVFLSAKKEPMFFAVYGHNRHYLDIRTRRPVNFVVDQLDDYIRLFRAARRDQLLGEGSTWYLYFFQETIKNIRLIYGQKASAVKIFVVLRNPMDRAWSHYLFHKRNGEESMPFERAIQKDVIQERQEKHFLPGYDYLGFGRYSSPVKAYQEAFPHVKVLLFEDLVKHNRAVMDEAFDFLGLPAFGRPSSQVKLNVAGKPKNPLFASLGKLVYQPNAFKAFFKIFLPFRTRARWKYRLSRVLFTAEPMPRPIREKLKEVYREDICALSCLIGRDLNSWLA